MVLVVGGAYQGKLEYVKKEFNLTNDDIVNGALINLDNMSNGKCLYNFHKLIERLNNENINIDNFMENHKFSIIISNEIGCGVIPIDKKNRDLVELVGRNLCNLAKKANKVIKISCGLPIIIKG